MRWPVGYLGSMALVVVSLAAYQLAQRSVSARGDAQAPLLAAYVVGAIICGAALLFTSRSMTAELRELSFGSLVLGSPSWESSSATSTPTEPAGTWPPSGLLEAPGERSPSRSCPRRSLTNR
ncbi:MAG TPA: hypothetical protein VLK65_22340 [Vicinamibacteria bacterium]|nr:hypothetical protein [Vicinamibacteria bacterium]